MSTHPPGTPVYVDLSTTDLASATRFYTELFGWAAQVSPEPGSDSYTVFTKDGKVVAGAKTVADQPPVWSTHILVEDADAAAKRVEAAGGRVLMPATQVTELGRMAVCADPAGAQFTLWQAGTMPGAEIFNVPGALCWNELTTRDVEGAKEFYASVLGWWPKTSEMVPGGYVEFQVDGRSVAGMMPMQGDAWPADLPAHWMVYFAVSDTDAAAARAAELGGVACIPPTDTPAGRLAVLDDPTGAVFSIIRM
ncbi:MAG TPA: VOC family protein [Micromonosporaceae bacterium]|nr:VOC family protein [Micromonosporaceae bacterium]